MKRLFVITISFICILVGCTSHKDIYSYVKDQYEASDRQMSFNKFSEVNDFEWDTLYFFSAKASLEEINRILPIRIDDFVDVGDRIYFLKNNKVTYSECWYSVDLDITKGISINTTDTILIRTPKDAFFRIDKENDFFILTPRYSTPIY